MPSNNLLNDHEEKPSLSITGWWLDAERQQGDYPQDTERVGKWLFYVPIENVDIVWKAISDALIRGELGDYAKVATLHGVQKSPLVARPGYHVICVYTYDGEDTKDIMTIGCNLGRILTNCDFHDDLFWKPDNATYRGEYAKQGKPTSWYVAVEAPNVWRIKDLRDRPIKWLNDNTLRTFPC